MDSETGECFRDKETGEMPASAKINLETGEQEINYTRPERQQNTQKKFRVPNNNPRPQQKMHSIVKQKNMPTSPHNDSIRPSDVIPCLFILLPTLLFFHPAVAMCISIIEVVLHVWAHKKNKKLSNSDVYYQSPLHIFIREFCGACKWERSMYKITSIQDRRNYKFIKYGIDYVHGIVM